MASEGNSFTCSDCRVHVRKNPKPARYKETRTLKTKRGGFKAERNAWCVRCRNPMAKHGRYYHCPPCHTGVAVAETPKVSLRAEKNAWCLRCRKPTYKKGTFFQCKTCKWTIGLNGKSKPGKKTFGELSLISSGTPTKFKSTWWMHPYCRHCKRRMQRSFKTGSRGFKCGYCGVFTACHVSKEKGFRKRQIVLDLLNQGYPMNVVEKMAKTNWRILQEMKAIATPRRCKCGQVYFHRTDCYRTIGLKRGVKYEEHRSDFDNLLTRMNRVVGHAFGGIGDEIKEEIVMMMLSDVAASITDIINNKSEYLQRYKKMYPWQISIDGMEGFHERIAG